MPRPSKRSHNVDTAVNHDFDSIFAFLKNTPYVYKDTATPTDPHTFDLWKDGSTSKIYIADTWMVLTNSGDSGTGYIPYSGAIADVDLGDYGLTATDVTATNLTVGALSGILKATAGVVAGSAVHADLGTILGSGAYHLSSAEQTELNAWLDDVTLADGGSITIPSNQYITLSGTASAGTRVSGAGFQFSSNSLSWDVELSRKGANVLGTANAFTAEGAISGSALTTTGGVVTGANSTSLNIGQAIAGQLRIINSAVAGISAITMVSEATSVKMFSFANTYTSVRIHEGGSYDVSVFEASTVGINKIFYVYGYPTGSTGAVVHYGSTQIIHPATVDLCQFSTDCAGGFDFNAKAVSNVSTLAVTTSATINSVAVAVTTRPTDTFGACTDVTTNDATTAAHGLCPKFSDSAGLNDLDYFLENRKRRWMLWADFENSTDQSQFYTTVVNSAYISNRIYTTGQLGFKTPATGTNTEGKCAVSTSLQLILGGGILTLEWSMQVPVLSAATDIFRVYAGMTDTLNAAPTNGICFEYSHGTNSGKWVANVKHALAAAQALDTGITVDTNPHTFKIIVNANASQVDFYIDGALVATHNTAGNIPSGTGHSMQYYFNIIKEVGSTGTTNMVLSVDWAFGNLVFTTPRT